MRRLNGNNDWLLHSLNNRFVTQQLTLNPAVSINFKCFMCLWLNLRLFNYLFLFFLKGIFLLCNLNRLNIFIHWPIESTRILNSYLGNKSISKLAVSLIRINLLIFKLIILNPTLLLRNLNWNLRNLWSFLNNNFFLISFERSNSICEK